MKLSGDQCQCRGCGKYFNSTKAFDKHRVWKDKLTRICLDEFAMLAIGMEPNRKGLWVTQAMPQEALTRVQTAGDLPDPLPEQGV